MPKRKDDADILAEALERLTLSQADFARIGGVSPMAVYYWTSRRRPVPGWVLRFLEALEALPARRRRAIIAAWTEGSAAE